MPITPKMRRGVDPKVRGEQVGAGRPRKRPEIGRPGPGAITLPEGRTRPSTVRPARS